MCKLHTYNIIIRTQRHTMQPHLNDCPKHPVPCKLCQRTVEQRESTYILEQHSQYTYKGASDDIDCMSLCEVCNQQ